MARVTKKQNEEYIIGKWFNVKKDYKLSKAKVMKLNEYYEEPSNFEEEVKEEPYEIVINTLGKSFKQADEIIIRLFPSFKKSLDRCKWLCREILKDNESKGNTYMSATELAKIVWSNCPDVKEFVFDAVTKWNEFYYNKDKNVVALKNTYKNEVRIAEEILYRIDNPVKYDINYENYSTVDGFALTNEQKKVLELICNNSIVMLNGSAGTGKTSAMKALVNMIEDDGMYCTILAPTGIAAKRIAEVTMHNASTIHRFMASHSSFGDVLIIDEMSMVGVNLLGTLFMNMPTNVKIVFVCDEAQLASISCGNIVQDIIDSGKMPIANLTKVFRYGIGGIATVATDIRMGKNIDVNTEYNDYSFTQISDEPMKDIVNAYTALRTQYNEDEIMVLSPFNVHDAGTYSINSLIQNKYNNNPVDVSYTRQNVEIEFKVGDRIVNTENNYHMESADIEDSEISVMNGECGKVISIDAEYSKKGYLTNLDMVVEFENGKALLHRDELCKQLLAYSITVHKSQGSQAKAVIVVADKSHGFFLTRNLLYVAASRAQEKLIIIGDEYTINSSLPKVENKVRNTYLKELLVA